MPLNPSYEYAEAEQKFYAAQTDSERLEALEEMLRKAPSHKGSEKFRGDIRAKIKKTKEKIKKDKARGKGKSKIAIKKGDMQVVLVGLTNSGKSSVLKTLTNADPKIASYEFTTQKPEIGILSYENCPIQIIDLPAIGSENFETGIINTSDTILIIIQNIQEIPEVEKVLEKARAKRIVVFNKIDFYDGDSKRRISETLKTKKYNFAMISCKTQEGIENLKEKIFKSFDKIRIYTKSPNEKEPDADPIIVSPKTIVKNIAKIIFRGRLDIIKKIRIWGPSSKFAGQEVGINHILKDKDIIEFSTR